MSGADDDRSLGRIFDQAAAGVRSGSADWEALLQKRDNGGWLSTVNNACLIMHNDPRLRGMVAYDEFNLQVLLREPPPPLPGDEGARMPGRWPRPYDPDSDIAPMLAYFERRWTPRFSALAIDLAIKHEAQLNRFHPVARWLSGLRWDGIPRIDTWLHHAFRCPDDAYHAAVGSKVLIAAVRRVLEPGVKFDTMLVVEGEQGLGKSRVFRALVPEQKWFSDALHGNLRDRDAPLSLVGVWVMELAEIEQIIRHEAEVVKAFVSRQVDRIRPPYGRVFMDVPRQGVMVGTTNAPDWLRDPTGNRRFWPVRAAAARAAWVGEFRDQLWAEAYRRALDPEQTLWLDDAEVRRTAKDEQAARIRRDPWEDRIVRYLAGRSMVRVADVLTDPDGLDMPVARQDALAAKRVRDVLQELGWRTGTQRYERNGGRATKVWMPGPEAAAGDPAEPPPGF